MDKNEQYIQIDGLVSILIPVYNTEFYLAKCLDSLIGQTYKDLEISNRSTTRRKK